jgi:FkbM family methyltransferase
MEVVPGLIVLAFGSWGDVYPLLLLAVALVREPMKRSTTPVGTDFPRCTIVFVTHVSHAVAIGEQLEDAEIPIAGNTVSITMRYVDSPVVGSMTTSESDFYSLSSQCELLAELSNMCGIKLVLANLFSLQGYLLACSMKITCIFVHPHFLPSRTQKACPSLQHWVKKCAPALFRQVYRGSECGPGAFRNHLEQYLWPVLSSHYDCVRDTLKLTSPSSVGYVLPLPPAAVFLCHSVLLCPAPDDSKNTSMVSGTSICDNNASVLRVCGSFDDATVSDTVDGTMKSLLQTIQCLSSGPVGSQSCVCRSTLSCLNFISAVRSRLETPHGAEGKLKGTVIVDFGSMTTVICERYDIYPLLNALLALTDRYAFIILCHSAREHIYFCLCEILSQNSMYDGVNSNLHVVGGNVNHSWLLRHCVTVIHHGGSGTVSACLKSGVPQVVVPILHDQFYWAERLRSLNLTTDNGALTSREIIFPDRSDVTTVRRSHLFPTVVYSLASALAASTSPQHRLRCGCFGAKMRQDPGECGLSTVIDCIHENLFHIPYEGANDVDNLVLEEQMDSFFDFEIVDGSNGVISVAIACHYSAAPEETNYIFQEIFEDRSYARISGYRFMDGSRMAPSQTWTLQLHPNDVIVDVGANVGMFSVFCELEMDLADALRIIAIEPIPANTTLLKNNRDLYFPTGIVVETAVGVVDLAVFDDHNDSTEQIRNVEMAYFCCLPGNSCLSYLLSDKISQLSQTINPNLTSRMHAAPEFLRVPVRSFTDIMDEYIPKISPIYGETRIALVKVDVEGSEMNVLMSISEPYWLIIDQIIIEVTAHSSCSVKDSNVIMEMLVSRGFIVICDDLRRHITGNCMVVGSRLL